MRASSICSGLLLVTAGLAARGQATPSLTDSFQAFWSAAQGKAFAEQEALWDKYVEAPAARRL